MIWCRFEKNGEASFGIVEGDDVIKVDGMPIGGEHTVTSTRYPLKSVKLLVPVKPGMFYCAGLNYPDHIIKSAKRRGIEPEFPKNPDLAYRSTSALIAHEENIVKPKDAGESFQYEGELVAVIGKTAKHVSKEDAMSCIFGWTIGNDVSERVWQRADRTSWRAKNCDTFNPMGPWIVTGLDPKDMTTTVRLNGTVMEKFPTGNMLFDVATYISELTRYATIHPGDVIWLGTDGLTQNMKPGDTIEIEISGIGTLRNRVVAEQ